jgi:glycosyltransferase involved in cell wall biosynthesis
MHYRLAFYKRISNDKKFDFTLFYGKEDKGTKLVNADFADTEINNKKLCGFRVPFVTNNGKGKIQISPFLFFELIYLSPQIVFSEGSSSIINSSVAFIYAKIFKKKFIWWSLGMLKNRKYTGIRKLINRWEKIIENNCDAIFTYSNQGKEYFLSRGVQKERIFVGVNVLDTNEKLIEMQSFKNEKSNLTFRNNFNLSFIGSITKEKNIELLIDALEIFNKTYSQKGKLHIIGDGIHLIEIKDYLKAKKLTSSVIFYGRINRGANVVLKQCQVMVLPGLGGLSICEGMLNSLPIITGTADGTEIDLVDKLNGFVIPDLTDKILFKKIEYLYLNPHIRIEMGKKSFERITTNYSFDNYYKMFNETVNFVIK